MGELIRELRDTDKPLCPNIGWPGNDAHQLHNRTLDAFYNAAEKNADGDMPEPLDKAYQAAAYGPISDRMNLYVEQVGFLFRGQMTYVESWYFKCPICGCILPAQNTARP